MDFEKNPQSTQVDIKIYQQQSMLWK